MSGTTTYTIDLDASASFNGNDAPLFELLVDGQQVGSGVVNSNNVEDISFSASLTSGQGHTVSIVYTNHTLSSQLLNVQAIAINGQKISSSDPSETYVSPNGTFKSFGQMYFGGQVNFVLPASIFTAPAGTGTGTGSGSGGTPTGTGTGSGSGGAPTGTGTAPTTVTLGSGSDTLGLLLSEDAYAGDAQFTVSVDGSQIGGIQTVTASHAAAQTQLFDILGTFGSARHTVTVNFLNDAYGGTATTDRNLYVTGATIDGATVPNVALNETSGGPQSFTFVNTAAAPSSPQTVTIGSGPDTLSLSVAEDAFQGNAQFTISVDGVQQGGLQTTTANNSAGQTQTFNVLGTFGTTQHTVTVNFTNDAYGGSASNDRNLYVTGAKLNGQSLSGTALNEYSGGPQSFTFGTAPTPPVPTPPPPTPPPPTPTGAAFYVSPSGSNSGDGSASRPFATLQYSVSQMESRGVHTLYLQGGTYNVGSTVTLGSADNGDTILAAPGSTPVLNATSGTTTILSLNGAQNVTVSGLTFQNSAADPQGAALVLNGSNGDTVSGNSFSANAEAVLFTGSSSNTFSGNTILNSTTSAVEIKDASNSDLFSNNVINGVGATNVSGGAFYAHGASNDTFSNNLIENTAGNGITVEDFGYGTTQNVGNVITQNKILNTSDSAASTDDGAIYILGRGDNDLKTTISMNFVSNAGNVNPNSHVEGIYLDDNASGVNVTSNIVTGVQSDATELHAGYNDHFTNNIFDLGTTTRSAALIQQPEPDHPATQQPALTNDSYSQNIVIATQQIPYNTYVYYDPQAVNIAVHNNLYYNIQTGGTLPLNPPVTDSSPVFGNPNFYTDATGAYNIGAGSASAQIGFVPINMSLIGPH